jgi:hypothetical protein
VAPLLALAIIAASAAAGVTVEKCGGCEPCVGADCPGTVVYPSPPPPPPYYYYSPPPPAARVAARRHRARTSRSGARRRAGGRSTRRTPGSCRPARRAAPSRSRRSPCWRARGPSSCDRSLGGEQQLRIAPAFHGFSQFSVYLCMHLVIILTGHMSSL